MSRTASRTGSRRPARPWAIFLLLGFAALAAVFWVWHTRTFLEPARLRLARTTFQALPGWRTADVRAALGAFARSCQTLSREPPTHAMGGAGYAGVVADWLGTCAALPSGAVSAEGARSYFETWLTPVSVTNTDRSAALFTGYYEPEIRVSERSHGHYSTPIYGLPSDLVSANLGLFSNDLEGRRVEGRVDGKTFLPYFTRAEIDAHGLPAAPVLLYADDPVQVFFLHIQGSGRARLENGALLRLAYAGQNGRPYTPIGRTLIEESDIDRGHMSMQAICEWLWSHGSQARRVMESDQSFVFFRKALLGDPSLGSPGSEGVPLTPEGSIAVDAHLHPLGAPFFIVATAPDPDPARPDRALDRLFVAQDTGGAIKGAARADVFWGFGREAESIAGRMKSSGKFFVLLPRSLAVRLPAEP